MSNNAEPNKHADHLRQATYEFLSRRGKGENLSVQAFCDLHPNLMPDLAAKLESGLRRLRFVNEIQRAEGPSRPGDPQEQVPDALPSIRGYQILGEISGGGQGTVFKAVQESTGRTVAIKVVDSISSRQFHRFEREVQSLAKLSHPGIVAVIDRGRTISGALYLAMEFVPGVNLDAWTQQIRPQPNASRTIAEVFIAICRAIHAAHQASITHRDLKPSNIRVTPEGQVKVLDFGLSHHHGLEHVLHLTQTGNILGSIPWSSPEQARGDVRDVGPASDVYSLGVMLYEALTEKFPYPVGGPLHETTRHICTTPPSVPAKTLRLGSAIDSALWDIIKRALAKEPKDRFQSAADFGDALQSYLRGQWTVSAAPCRWRSIVATGAVSVAILTAAIWFLTSNDVPHYEPLVVKRPSFTNSVGMKMVKLSASPFLMGSIELERGHQENEAVHKVIISSPFWIGSTEVTRSQFRKVMGYVPKDVADGDEDLPVDRVTWVEARQFCEKLSFLEGKSYRLPSEAEWEYACRAGTMTAFAGLNNLDQIGWYAKNSGGILHPVGRRLPNNWGLYDMSGNVSEWVEDGSTTYPGDRGTSAAPQGFSEFAKVIRGGDITKDALRCRSAARTSGALNQGLPFVGFRIALDAPTTSENPSTAP